MTPPRPQVPLDAVLFELLQNEVDIPGLNDWCMKHGFRSGPTLSRVRSLVEEGRVRQFGTRHRPKFAASDAVNPKPSSPRILPRRGGDSPPLPSPPAPLALPPAHAATPEPKTAASKPSRPSRASKPISQPQANALAVVDASAQTPAPSLTRRGADDRQLAIPGAFEDNRSLDEARGPMVNVRIEIEMIRVIVPDVPTAKELIREFWRRPTVMVRPIEASPA